MKKRVHISIKKAFFFWGIIFCAQASLFAEDHVEAPKKKPIEILRRFNKKGDSTNLGQCVQYLIENLDKNDNPELISELLKATSKAEARNMKQLSGLYTVLKKHYDNTGNKSGSFEYALKIYKLLSKTQDVEDLLWTLVDIGNIFYIEQDYQQARIFYQRAEKIAARGKDMYPFSVIYLNYGLIEEDQGNHRKALEYYKISGKYRAQSENIKAISNTYIKIANTYLKLDKPDSCHYYLLLAEDYYYHKGEETGTLIDMPDYIYFTYAEYYAYFKDFKKAHIYIRKGQDYCRRAGIIEELIVDTETEANYYSLEKKYKEAIRCATQMMPYLIENGMLEEQKKIYWQIGSYYSKLGDYEKSDQAMKNYMLLDDSLDYTTLRSQLNMIRSIATVYESDAKLEHAKKNLHIEEVNNNLRIKERNTSILISTIALVLILILLFLFFKLRANRRKLMNLHNRLVSQNQDISINSLELERTNQLKDKLFSIIAHDLRNPLNRLMVELAIVKKSAVEKSITTQMENTLKETIDLFEGLLQWSKLDNKQNIYSPTKINLNDNISKALAFYAVEIRERQICVINSTKSMTAFADQNILQTLLRNLISNAISSVSGEASGRTIEIESRETPGNRIEIIFRDSGPGFPEKIIREFHSETNDINSDNNGLGLSICKLLAKMSGWEMEISNGENTGAMVTIGIPMFIDPQFSQQQSAAEAENLSAAWKIKLGTMKTYKFYQTSQIRNFIRSLGDISDIPAKSWIAHLETAVHDGDEAAYRKLISMLDER